MTATAGQINAAADASARMATTSLTNVASLALSASTPVVVLRGIGSTENHTNTVTLATLYPVAGGFLLTVNSQSTNLIKITDASTNLAMGADVLLGLVDTLVAYMLTTNKPVKISTPDN